MKFLRKIVAYIFKDQIEKREKLNLEVKELLEKCVVSGVEYAYFLEFQEDIHCPIGRIYILCNPKNMMRKQ